MGRRRERCMMYECRSGCCSCPDDVENIVSPRVGGGVASRDCWFPGDGVEDSREGRAITPPTQRRVGGHWEWPETLDIIGVEAGYARVWLYEPASERALRVAAPRTPVCGARGERWSPPRCFWYRGATTTRTMYPWSSMDRGVLESSDAAGGCIHLPAIMSRAAFHTPVPSFPHLFFRFPADFPSSQAPKNPPPSPSPKPSARRAKTRSARRRSGTSARRRPRPRPLRPLPPRSTPSPLPLPLPPPRRAKRPPPPRRRRTSGSASARCRRLPRPQAAAVAGQAAGR